MSPRELTLEWYRRVWNLCELGAIDEMMADSALIEGLDEKPAGKEEFRRFRDAIHTVFDNVRVDILDLVEENNQISGLSIAHAIHRETGKPIEINVSFVCEWRNGKLIWGKNVVDYLGLMQQLGATDPTIFVSMLKGENQKLN